MAVMEASAIGRREFRGLPVETLTYVLSAAGAFLGAIPWGVKAAVIVAFVLTILDTVTGVWLAARTGAVSTHTMREKLTAKVLQFLILGTMGACASLITQVWQPFGAAMGVIVGIEAASNLENLTRLEHNGGAPLGPFRPVIWRLSKYFAVSDEPKRIKEEEQ